ncbi:MAG: SRPBCC family protein [Burkholderiaceae bacterium]
MPPTAPQLIDDRPDEGVFRVHRDAFRDPDIFAAEVKHLFEGGWVFVGHASQIPNPHDYITTSVGQQPIVLMRAGDGSVGGFLNTCRHKGAMVCHQGRGNRKLHVCHYHAWSYSSAGKNIAIKDESAGAYTEAFKADCHDLQTVAAFEEYRGFLFASLTRPAHALADYLGDARIFIDLIVDQSPDGIEIVPGTVSYTYKANWKLQLENSTDAYHFTSTHPSYLRLLERRAKAADRQDVTAAIWQDKTGSAVEEQMGSFGFEHGHALVWTDSPIERHPLYDELASLSKRVGQTRSRWMLKTRQFNIFPNLQLASNAALQMRVVRPLAADLTEIKSYCIAPKGEPPEKRRQRLRQYEDFFNPSGLATPDDTVTFEDCQRGFECGAVQWQQGYMRGMTQVMAGPDDYARELGIHPAQSVNGPFSMSDETIFHTMYRAWARRLS